MSVINKYLLDDKNLADGCREPYGPTPFAKRIVCTDGFEMSVQASRGHYCSPRNNYGPWESVEVGYPSAVESLLLPNAEDIERPTDTVYGYVPVDVVDAIIEKHGGLACPAAE